MNPCELRNLAMEKIKDFPAPRTTNPIEALEALQWEQPTTVSYTQEELSFLNLNLDMTYCYGRTVGSVAYIEKYFQNTKIECGEVLEDAFRNIMLETLSSPPLRTEIEELLMYEEPHLIPVINGQQYEPLSVLMRQTITHPRIKVFPAWKCLISQYLISQSILEKNPGKKLELLLQSQEFAPTFLAKENLASVYLTLNRMDDAKREMAEVAAARPTLFSLLGLYFLYEDKESYKIAVDIYPLEVIQYVKQEIYKL